ncbi:MAG: RHS repeat-associated core domain-containing protein, partial [Planctomycetia bacterium]|nr:RHS repeat-associated core domain-containing protein [Planctomycetia bacterium]
DNQGTTRDLAYNTGVPAAHYTYDVFGQVLSGDTSLTQYLYTAREYDAATGLQYNRERWYDPHTGRWISQDPIGLAADANPYRYVGNDPTNTMDPSRLGPSTQKIAVRHYRSFAIHLKSASLRRERTGRGSN